MGSSGLRFGLIALLLVGTVGCDGRTRRVKGLVTLDGRPVPGATVLFMPEGPGGGRPASAFTGLDGAFTLTTFRPGDGATPGAYRVLVRKTEATPDQEAANRSARERAEGKVQKLFGPHDTKPVSPDAMPNSRRRRCAARCLLRGR
jgi:hypothetical protein